MSEASETPLVYVLFGIPDSERRSVLLDLIESGLPDSTEVLYFKPKAIVASPIDAQLEGRANVHLVEWELREAKVLHGSIEAAPQAIFFLAPGESDPADVAEAVKTWSDHNNCNIARLVTLIHCDFLQANPGTQAWFNACIHFSDFVLLAKRANTSPKWIKEFQTSYHKAHVPSRFEMVKKGRAPNPLEVLEPEVRRTSFYFDELIPIEEDAFEEDLPEDQKPDKYIERLESKQRAYPVPDIRKWLHPKSNP
jgi:hypothetical protein